MRIFITLILVSLTGLIAAADEPKEGDKPQTHAKVSDGEESQEKPVSFWMEKKLEYSQEMLKGLVTGDLELVATKARQMRFVSKVEGWIRKGKPGYREHLQAFDFANAEIERHSTAENLEGAAMAFQQLTISCVSCHSMMRNPE